MPSLVRGVRKWDALALALNSVIGAGIFGLPSRAYALAGTFSLVVYLVAALAMMLIVVCFAEVGSRFSATGGPYLYAREAFGPLIGFQVGWLMWLARVASFAALCNLFIDYLGYFVPVSGAGIGRVLVVCGVVLLLTLVNAAGVRVTTTVTNVFTAGKGIPLLLLIAGGIFFVRLERYAFSAPPSYASFSQASLFVAFAYAGFESAIIPTGELREPARHIPFALLCGMSLIAVLYVLIQAVCIGTLPQLASSERPLAEVGLLVFGPAGAAIVSAGALVSIAGTMNTMMFATPRLLFAMAEQGQIARIFSATDGRFHTPYVATLATALVMLGLTLFSSFISALTISTIIRLITYATTCAALPVLRSKGGARADAYSAPAGLFVSAAAVVLTAWLVSASTWRDAGLVLAAAFVGVLLYLPGALQAGKLRPSAIPS